MRKRSGNSSNVPRQKLAEDLRKLADDVVELPEAHTLVHTKRRYEQLREMPMSGNIVGEKTMSLVFDRKAGEWNESLLKLVTRLY